MARLSFLLACLLGLTTTVSAAALPSAHEDLPWNVNNKRSPLPSPFGKKGYGGKGKGGKHHGPGFVEDDTCALLQELPVKAPKENLWLDLTNDEVKGLLQWLHAPEQGLNLTEYAKAGAWDNYVTVTEAIMPNKTSVLSYLSGKGPKPDKYARVVISNGATEEAYLEDFEIGPLPISKETTIKPFTWAYNRGDNSKTPNYSADNRELTKFKQAIGNSIADITLDILGTYYNSSSNSTSALQAIDPLQKEDGRIIQWVQWRLAGKHAYYTPVTLLPQGLYMKFDITGRVPANWKLLGILYNDIYYNSSDPVAEFRAAWEKPDFVKLPKAEDGDWAWTGQKGSKFELDHLDPPVQVQSEKRWKVDKDARYVEWMAWSFYIGFSRDVGITLWDIKYDGQTIIYELGLQEAIAHYAGQDPKASGTAFLDGYYGFGPYVYELVKGYDCPLSASYLDTTLYQNGNTTTNHDSICMFEQDAGFPLSRHTTGKYTTVTKNIQFIVRSVATIGNYDYLFDYVFMLDGSVEVKVRASGYIQAAYFAHNEDYGYHIMPHLSGSMHDHVLTFKADIDIKGTANSFETTTVVPKAIKYPWSPAPRNTMTLERSILETEKDAKINWAPNGANIYSVLNTDAKNAYGESAGYRIMPGIGTPIHTTITDSPSLLKSASFGNHHLFVTKQHDNEPRLAHAAANMNSGEPLVDFSKFFNDESLKQEDLVVWFNLGMHHVPHTGDLGMTVMTTAQSSVVFTPHNYFAGDEARRTVQQVEVVLGKGENGASKVESYGKSGSDCPTLLSAYSGAETVSKMDFLEYSG